MCQAFLSTSSSRRCSVPRTPPGPGHSPRPAVSSSVSGSPPQDSNATLTPDSSLAWPLQRSSPVLHAASWNKDAWKISEDDAEALLSELNEHADSRRLGTAVGRLRTWTLSQRYTRLDRPLSQASRRPICEPSIERRRREHHATRAARALASQVVGSIVVRSGVKTRSDSGAARSPGRRSRTGCRGGLTYRSLRDACRSAGRVRPAGRPPRRRQRP